MNLDDIYTFVLLVNLRNFTRVSEALNVVQSTVSNRIRSLENHLGVQLVIREKNGIRLTPEGKIFYNYAKTICELSEVAIQETLISSQYRGVLKIGSIQWFSTYSLNKLIHEFTRQNEEIAISLTIGHSSELIPSINKKQLDIAYISMPVDSYNVESELAHTEPAILVGPPKFKNLSGGIDASELATMPIIYSDIWDNFISEVSDSAISDRKAFRISCNMLDEAKAFCLSGLGCCFLPQAMAERELEDQSLVEIPINNSSPKDAKIYSAYSKWKKSYALEKWLAFIEDYGEELSRNKDRHARYIKTDFQA